MQLVLIVSVLNLLLSPRLGNIYLNMNILVEFSIRVGKNVFLVSLNSSLVRFLYSYLFCLTLKLSLDRLP